MDLANIVDESEQAPLYIDFLFGTQSKVVHALVHTDIGKDRFHDPKSPGINALALLGIDLGLHLIDQVGRLRTHWDRKIPARSRWFAQTACPQRTDGAVLCTSMVDIIGSKAVGLVAGMAGQFFPMRAEINLFDWIEREIRNAKEPRLRTWSLPAVNASLETLLIGKARVTFAELDVGDVGIDLFILAHRQAVERMIVAIGGQLLALKIGFIFSDGGDVFFALVNIGSRFS